MKYYAVRKGRNPGIFSTWLECSKSITGFKGAEFKSFKSLKEAQDFSCTSESQLSDSDKLSDSLKLSNSNVDKRIQDPEKPQVLAIYTDGACKSNGTSKSIAGYGVYYGDNDPRNISKKLLGSIQTNNRAELMGVIEALDSLESHTEAIIYTDSQYVQKGLESWLSNWKKRNWKTVNGSPVLNQDLWKILDESKRKKPLVKICYVKGHAGIKGNEMADKLAVQGCFKNS